MFRIIVIVLIIINLGLLLAIYFASPSDPKINPKTSLCPTQRIVGGKRVSIHSHSYMAGIIVKKHGEMKVDMLQCGCTIIATNWVVTAAHCIKLLEEQKFPKSMVFISSTNSKWIRGKKHQVMDWICHEKYEEKGMSNDIALIRIKEPFKGIREKPIPIANEKYEYKPDRLVTVTGWGLMSEGGDVQQVLRGVMVKMVTQRECSDMYSPLKADITDSMFCAGYPGGGKDACQFDSGGPVTDKNLLIGIVSWGNGCARPNYPGVYTRISLFEEWITQTTNRLGFPLNGTLFRNKP